MLLQAQLPDSPPASLPISALSDADGGAIRQALDATLRRLVALIASPALLLVPAQAWERFSDQADEVWEPFLLDD